MPSGLDVTIDTEVRRRDNRLVLARNRQLASIVPVRLAYDADGYYPGQVIARNTVSGYYQKYDSGGSSGTDTAAAILFSQSLDMTTDTEDVGQAIMKGEVYYDNCTDIDANAVTDLNGRTYVDGNGNTILLF